MVKDLFEVLFHYLIMVLMVAVPVGFLLYALHLILTYGIEGFIWF